MRLFILLSTIFLVACSDVVPLTPMSNTPYPTETNSPVPTETETPVPTITLTPTPAPLVISPGNVKNLLPFATIGNGYIQDVAVSPDGKLLAFAKTIGVYLYDADTLTLNKTIPTNGQISRVTFSPDGDRIIGGQSAPTFFIGYGHSSWGFPVEEPLPRLDKIFIWDVETGKALEQFDAPAGGIFSLTASPDGCTIAYAQRYGNPTLKNTCTNEDLVIDSEGSVPEKMAISPDGRTLVINTSRSFLEFWDIESEELLRRSSGVDWVQSMVFNQSGTLLALGTRYGEIRIIDMDSLSILHQILGHQEAVKSLVFTADDSILISGGGFDDTVFYPNEGYEKTMIRTWDVGAGTMLQEFSDHEYSVMSLSFLLEDEKLTSVGKDGTINQWDIDFGEKITTYSEPSTLPNDIDFSPDGQLLASADDDGKARIWDVKTQNLVHVLAGGQSDSVRAVDFSPDGQLLASSGWDATVSIWDVESGTNVHKINAHPGSGSQFWVNDVKFSPDGTTVASIAGGGIVKLWDIQTGEEKGGFVVGGRLIQVDFSLDGTLLAVSSGHGKGKNQQSYVTVWNVETGKQIFSFNGRYVGFTPDGNYLSTGEELRNITTGEKLESLHIHAGTIFSPDGKLSAIPSNRWSPKDYGFTIFFDSGSTFIKGHNDVTTSIVFSPDGRIIASAGRDGTIILWRVTRP